jgi:PAS domain S-box-containing protein
MLVMDLCLKLNRWKWILMNSPDHDHFPVADRLIRFAWLPIPLLLAAVAGLWAADLRTSYESRNLLLLLNLVFTYLVSLCIAYLAARSFVASGQSSLVMLSCGALLWGSATMAASALVDPSENLLITVHNGGVFGAALCHLGGLLWPVQVKRRGRWLAMSYGAVLIALALFVGAATKGWMPVFFVQGQGGTLIRQIVLLSAIVMFALVAWLMLTIHWRQPSKFFYWYGLGLALLAIGLVGVLLQSVAGGVLGWTGRVAQFLGGVYLFIASITAARETGGWKISLPAVRANTLFSTSQRQTPLRILFRYGLAVVAVAAAMGLRMWVEAWLGSGLPTYITFYPAVMAIALLAGLGPGLMATALVDFTAGFWILPPIGAIGIALPIDRVGLIIFTGMGLFMSLVAEFYRRNRDKAAAYDREAALRQAHERLVLAQQSAGAGIWDWDIATGRLEWSRELFQLFGLDPAKKEASFEIWRSALHPEDRKAAEERIAAAIRDRMPLHSEYRIVLPTGEIRWISALGNTRYDENGNARNMLGLCLDITERKQAEKSLQEKEERYRALFNGMTEGFATHEIITDERGIPVNYRFLDINPSFERLTGLKREDVIGKTVNEVLPGEDPKWLRMYGSVALTGKAIQFENYSPALGRHYEALAYSPAPRHFAVIFMDISARKQAEEALTALNASLEQRVAERTNEVQQLADQLRALAVDLSKAEQRERKRLSKILHDHIQQLLVAARMQVGWLKRDTNAERMRTTAQGVDSIIQEALDASRSLTIELSPPVLQEMGLVGGLSWLVSHMQEKHQFKVHLRSDNKAEPASEETRYLLFECVRELLFNTVKHTGVMEAHVALLLTRDNRIELIIRDDGRGFDPDLLKERRVNEATFGLFSIQQRLAHIGGEMEIATAPGKGTSITILLPDEQGKPLAEEKALAAEQGENVSKVHVRKKSIVHRVLVVDDHKIMREGLVGLMQFEPDIEVIGQAADGPHSIELAEQLQPDVIIMDVNLGEMNGVEATKHILAKLPTVKIIGLSMHTDSALANAMREAGAIAYLTKGGPAADLIAAIRAACAG